MQDLNRRFYVIYIIKDLRLSRTSDFSIQEPVNYIIRACGIVVKIYSMASIGLNIGFKVVGGHHGEALCHSGGNRGYRSVAGCETIATTKY